MTVGPVARDASTADFLDGTARGHFLLRHCNDCGAFSEPQAAICFACGSTSTTYQPANGAATLVSWVISHSKPDASGSTDQTILGIVQLAEGPWWWTQIRAEPSELGKDLPLVVKFERHPDSSEFVPVFESART